MDRPVSAFVPDYAQPWAAYPVLQPPAQQPPLDVNQTYYPLPTPVSGRPPAPQPFFYVPQEQSSAPAYAEPYATHLVPDFTSPAPAHVDPFYATLAAVESLYDEETQPGYYQTEISALPQASVEEAAEPRDKRGRRGVLSLVLNVLVFALCVVLTGGAVAFTVSNKKDKSFFGYRFYNVLSESMTPTIQPDGTMPKGGFYTGDAIIVKLIAPENVKVDDIITYNTSSAQIDDPPLTHRVVEIVRRDNGLYFVTKGDHNATTDPELPSTALIGVKVAAIPKLGHVMRFAQKHFALTIVICVTVMGIVFVLFLLTSLRSDGKKRTKREKERDVESSDDWYGLPPNAFPAPEMAEPAYAAYDAGYRNGY
jgi:signal peptidase I